VSAAVGQPGAGQLLLCEAALDGLPHERRAARGETDPILAADFLPEATAREVGACVGACLRLPEVALVERGRRVQHPVEAVAAPAPGVLLWRCLLVLERDVEPLREPFDRAYEFDAFGLLDERDCVAGRPAAEAVVEPFLRADREGRRPLLVEGTEAREAPARAAQLRSFRDDLDDVRGRLDRLD